MVLLDLDQSGLGGIRCDGFAGSPNKSDSKILWRLYMLTAALDSLLLRESRILALPLRYNSLTKRIPSIVRPSPFFQTSKPHHMMDKV